MTTGHSIAAGTLRPPSHRSSRSTGSIGSREGALRANTTSNFGMMNADRSRTRRERTFVGAECAVCEEPLEHTLRGERILQFSCSHVSHEACFYEFIREFESQYCPTCNAPLHLDTSRGGNVLDIGTSSRPSGDIVVRRATDLPQQRKSVTWSDPSRSMIRDRRTHLHQQRPRRQRRHQHQRLWIGMTTRFAHPAEARLRDNPQWALCRPHPAAASETTTRTDTREDVQVTCAAIVRLRV